MTDKLCSSTGSRRQCQRNRFAQRDKNENMTIIYNISWALIRDEALKLTKFAPTWHSLSVNNALLQTHGCY